MVSVKHPSQNTDTQELGGEQWLQHLVGHRPEAEREVLTRALALARQAHAGQKRLSGEPYLSHVLAVAEILNDLNLDYETLAAAMLHDTVEDTVITLAQIERDFGPSIARLVDGVTKMGRISRL